MMRSEWSYYLPTSLCHAFTSLTTDKVYAENGYMLTDQFLSLGEIC